MVPTVITSITACPLGSTWRTKPCHFGSVRFSYRVYTRSSKRPANFQQRYSKYTC